MCVPKTPLAMTGLTILVWLGLGAPARAVCVENQDQAPVFFVIEPVKGSGERQAFWLQSGGKFCGGPDRGDVKVYVRVFASDEDMEGCSYISTATQTVRLDKLGLYDRCAWTVSPALNFHPGAIAF